MEPVCTWREWEWAVRPAWLLMKTFERQGDGERSRSCEERGHSPMRSLLQAKRARVIRRASDRGVQCSNHGWRPQCFCTRWCGRVRTYGDGNQDLTDGLERDVSTAADAGGGYSATGDCAWLEECVMWVFEVRVTG
jgi:hypothetical protein